MIYAIILYVVVGIVVTLLNMKVDKYEGVEESRDYFLLPLTWFPEMIIDLISDWGDDSDLDLQ